MTKQKEIREGMFTLVREADYKELPEIEWEYALVDSLWQYLHSQGVVIRVDGELPIGDIPEKYNELACGAEDDTDNIARASYLEAQQDMLKVGYVVVEPLIKEIRASNATEIR